MHMKLHNGEMKRIKDILYICKISKNKKRVLNPKVKQQCLNLYFSDNTAFTGLYLSSYSRNFDLAEI